MPDINNIKRNTNDFSFTNTVDLLVNNKEYGSGYKDLVNGKINDKTYFWQCLSAVGEEVGEVIYENVLNYINNVANINTCKLKALTSIAKVLGIREFAILKNLDTIPTDVLNLMDIFSINRAYLLDIRNFNSDFVKDLLQFTLNEETLLSVEEHVLNIVSDDADISSYNILGAVSKEKYSEFVEQAFFKLLSNKLFQSYGNLSGDIIYSNLSALNAFSLTYDLATTRSSYEGNTIYNIYEFNQNNSSGTSSQVAFSTANYPEMLHKYKMAFNVKPGFDERKIVDNIEAGTDFLDNYQGGELSVLQLEIEERAKPKFSGSQGYAYNRSNTRYSYYNEIEVKQYVKFIDDLYLLNITNLQYSKWNPLALSNSFSPYFLDSNYSDITISSNVVLSSNIEDQMLSVSKLIEDNVPFSSFVYDYYGNVDVVFDKDSQLSDLSEQNLVRMVAKILTDICFAITNIREKLKTQAQRNYMTGTKLLVEYILDEYLLNALIYNYGVDSSIALSSGLFGTKLVEYTDSTEYYNIGTLSDENGFTKTSVNPPFFQDLSKGGQTATTTGVGLVANSIRNFYLSTLNIKSNYIKTDEDYYDFMSAVYEVGISKTYIGNDGAIVFDKSGLSNILSLDIGLSELCAKKNLTTDDYNYLKDNLFIETDDGLKYLNYAVLSNYWEEISSKAEKVSSDLEIYNDRLSLRIAQQTELTLLYHGFDIAYYPWYNYKNQDFPTFQSHPYLYNFIEHIDTSYPIENSFYGNANVDLVYELQNQNISVYLGNYGNIKRIWRNGSFDYSGYKSRYENSTHTYSSSNSNGLYSVTHYDGLFYPPAIELYKKYYKKEIFEPGGLSGFDLLSAHMTICVDNDCYTNSNLDISEISSMWYYYSHLNLTNVDRTHIVEQLLKLSDDILEMSDADFRMSKGDSSVFSSLQEPYDIYKYGLDYNKNSILLLKRYVNEDNIVKDNDSVSQTEKRNTLGQLWIKFNSHPIAFPAFLKGERLSSCQQVSFENENKLLDSSYKNRLNGLIIHNVREEGGTSPYGSKCSLMNVYDFDLASNGRYFVYAIENPSENVSNKAYKNAVILASSIYQSRSTNYIDPTKESTKYRLLVNGPKFLYPTNDGPYNNFNQNSLSNLSYSEYEFDGFFQERKNIYAGYYKRIIDNSETISKIAFNVIQYPENLVESSNDDSLQFIYNVSYAVEPLNNDIAVTKKDAKIKLGYSENTFNLVVTNEVKDSSGTIQNFIGNNSISAKTFGKTNYLSATQNNIDNQFNSFDRFTELVSIYELTKDNILNITPTNQPAIYALNSDASYVPLYPGTQGQNLYYNLKRKNNNGYDVPASYNKEWHLQDELSNEFVSKQSVELLGYSFQDIENLKQKHEFSIYKDKYTGKYTNIKGVDLLESSIRVYEDFELSDYIYQAYNKGGVFSIKQDGSYDPITIAFDNIRLQGLNTELSSEFNILLLNVENGKDRNPILAGQFSNETISSPHYNTVPTKFEQIALSTHWRNPHDVRIVGTPNPFNSNDLTLNDEYSNHLFFIKELSCNLESNNDGTYKLNVVLYPGSIVENYNLSSFAVQTNSLVLFIYKNTLSEFQKYHYMTPFSRHPFNAAMSVWNEPWKDCRYPWLYLDGYLSSNDGWKSENAYIDLRNRENNYKDYLLNNGVNVSAIVGNLNLNARTSAYTTDGWNLTEEAKSKYNGLSIMENIDVSKLSSLDEDYYFSRGDITWKISEEDKINGLINQYPPTLIDCFLYEKFGSTNKEYIAFNAFDLSNTFIFQLEDPLSVANRIGKIAVPYGSTANEYGLVYEDYLSSFLNVDIGGTNIYNYLQMLFNPNDGKDIIIDEDLYNLIQKLSSSSELSIPGNTDEEIERYLSSHHLYPEQTDKSDKFIVTDYHIIDVKPEDISECLKLYVNWKKVIFDSYENRKDEITLYFNFQNLFSSPYSFRTKNGRFSVEFKTNTYLKLDSGEDGYLYIILQFKYYDSMGELCGIRDLPIISYHIFNVSDDKPKFVITKTFEIDNRDGKYTYSNENNTNDVYIIIESKKYNQNDKVFSSNGKISIDEAINNDYTTNCDLYLNTDLQIFSTIPLSTLNIEMTYDRGKMLNSTLDNDPELVFESKYSYPGNYSENLGIISASFENPYNVSKLEFTLLNGTLIDETTGNRTFPIEIMNATGVDIHGNTPNFIFINGSIDLNDISAGIYLAREIGGGNNNGFNGCPVCCNDSKNRGFILEENNGFYIRMFNSRNKGEFLYILTEDGRPIKTTNSRESRLDFYNDQPLLCEQKQTISSCNCNDCCNDCEEDNISYNSI